MNTYDDWKTTEPDPYRDDIKCPDCSKPVDLCECEPAEAPTPVPELIVGRQRLLEAITWLDNAAPAGESSRAYFRRLNVTIEIERAIEAWDKYAAWLADVTVR